MESDKIILKRRIFIATKKKGLTLNKEDVERIESEQSKYKSFKSRLKMLVSKILN